MAKSPPSFDFYPNDWIGGTRHLPLIARACYLELLCFQWQNGHIPHDPAMRQMLTGLPNESWRTVWEQIKDKFEPTETEDGVRLANPRMQIDREESIERWLQRQIASEKLSESRRKAASARWNKQNKPIKQGGKRSNANAMQMQCKNMQTGKEEGGSRKDIKKKRIVTPKMPDGFVDFWDVVHLKAGKGAARSAYSKALQRLAADGNGDPAGYLAERMTAFAQTPQANPTDRSPIHPATWLNQERYDDDPATWNRVAKTSGRMDGMELESQNRQACQQMLDELLDDPPEGEAFNGNGQAARSGSDAGPNKALQDLR